MFRQEDSVSRSIQGLSGPLPLDSPQAVDLRILSAISCNAYLSRTHVRIIISE